MSTTANLDKQNVKGAYKKLSKKDVRAMYWRLQIWGLGTSVNSTSAQAISFMTCIAPVLKVLYKDAPKEERVEAMKRHSTYFLSQNTASGMILGITAAIEESTNESEKDAVVAIKAGMMGPLAGIGDSVFKITIQAIAGSIGAAYAIQGNFLGFILMFLIYNGINIAIKYGGVIMGYEKGVEFINSGEQAKIMQTIINLATMVGVIVLGSLIGSSVRLSLKYSIVVGETVVALQTLADQVMPKLLPFLFTVALYFLNRKMPRKYLIFLILGILVVGTMLALGGVI